MSEMGAIPPFWMITFSQGNGAAQLKSLHLFIHQIQGHSELGHKEPLCTLEKGASALMWPPSLQMPGTALANWSSYLSPRPNTFVHYENCTTRGKGTPEEEKTYMEMDHYGNVIHIIKEI